ncbi:type II toxin-antitoxin system RelE/ParE family toxin [Candidatus Gracilibacteria bacterium]|nr:type II toxin-antitoxin system RelE/ParE family toxin [Candidatus Gracilibacteria bacterium]
MKIVYLPSSISDLEWMKQYYESVFPEGSIQAYRHVLALEGLLQQNPFIGNKTEHDDVREIPIRKTPFSLIYRVTDHQIQILRVWDQRRER